MIYNLLNTLVLLGSLQGFILGILLIRRKNARLPNRLLGALLGLIALASLNVYLNTQTWYNTLYFCKYFDALFPFMLPMTFGPLLFLYTRATLDPGFAVTRRDRLHVVPVLIDLIPYGFAWCVVLGFIPSHHGSAGRFIDTYNVYADIPRWLSITFYVFLSMRYARLYRTAPGYSWIRECLWVFAGFQAIWLVYLVPYILPKYTYWMLDHLAWYPLFLPLGVLTYWLGLKGYTMVYPRTSSVSGHLASLLIKAVEDGRLFLNPQLNLDQLAAGVGLSPKMVSAVLNQHLRKNFTEFINEYRVRAFQERIQTGHDNHLTIAGIASECGFNSQATFQRIFKQYTGLTPSAFRKTTQIRK
ncbi:helix-turn-helix domain-containing protein [Dinghuibacter silviterrae]|uniref:AraC family transcriptional regulator n=1 Tax=Dinghuibacter silviterrae TaxID=1539049 RepID=A0A4R8DG46_9BACT|nr:helix-turn-helix transcriptional regulator [Dinghuibacter silviterrae]TDW96224.1 AraC family transcriptional regulator [Dinghuibacter silviterrae]